MTGERYVATKAIREAVRGRETDILDALGIDWRRGRPHIHCPYRDHTDNDPSWRWDERRSRALCTCIAGSDSILDVVDLASADFVVAVKEEEHRPPMRERFVEWEHRLDYWNIHPR